ncbi:hypothetical protein EPN87_01885 [archaeon]|nr:MAG: hypothetical protein EPN87_01885 [archaeon]
MKTEQKINLVYAALGAGAGAISNSVTTLIAFGAAIAIFAASFAVMKRYVRTRKNSWLLSNSLASYLLTWLSVWILMFNLI